jgi:nucleoside-diphosphate-sugar epimerase
MAISGETINIFGTGEQLRDFNYVDDVVNAFLVVTDQPETYGHIYNLGAHEWYSLLTFVKILKRYCDFEYQLVPFPPEHHMIDIGDYYGDFSCLSNVTGWEPKVSLEEGLRRTVEYFKPLADLYW